jgi:DNA-binding MarR family transcriptional regulator
MPPLSGNGSDGGRFRARSDVDMAARAIEKAVRRIVRAHDLQSRALAKTSGVTSAQLAVMMGIAELGEVTSVAISRHADISAATVVTVLDNLEDRGLIERYRSGADRRIVHTRLTERGRAIVGTAPALLGERVRERIAGLDPERCQALVAAAQALADLLSAETTSAA